MSFAPLDAITSHTHTDKKLGLPNIMLMGISVLLIALVPLLLTNSYYMRIAVLIFMYTAMSVGWNIIGGYANQTSLGHAVFFGVGAYTSVLLELRYGITPWVGIPVGILASVLVAFLIGWATFRLSGHYFALATLALLQVTNILFTYFSGVTGGSSGLTVPIMGNKPSMFQFDSQVIYYYISATIMIVVLIVARWVLNSALGYRLRAIKGNPEAARLAGVNMMQSKMIALIISAVITGMVGGFYAQYMQYIDPNTIFSFDISINMALFAIIGGVNSWWGPILGCLMLIPLNQYSSLVLTGQWAPLGAMLYGALLIIVILLKPRGLAEWLSTGWGRLSRRRSNSESA